MLYWPTLLLYTLSSQHCRGSPGAWTVVLGLVTSYQLDQAEMQKGRATELVRHNPWWMRASKSEWRGFASLKGASSCEGLGLELRGLPKTEPTRSGCPTRLKWAAKGNRMSLKGQSKSGRPFLFKFKKRKGRKERVSLLVSLNVGQIRPNKKKNGSEKSRPFDTVAGSKERASIRCS